jgi:hypothetical protein
MRTAPRRGRSPLPPGRRSNSRSKARMSEAREAAMRGRHAGPASRVASVPPTGRTAAGSSGAAMAGDGGSQPAGRTPSRFQAGIAHCRATRSTRGDGHMRPRIRPGPGGPESLVDGLIGRGRAPSLALRARSTASTKARSPAPGGGGGTAPRGLADPPCRSRHQTRTTFAGRPDGRGRPGSHAAPVTGDGAADRPPGITVKRGAIACPACRPSVPHRDASARRTRPLGRRLQGRCRPSPAEVSVRNPGSRADCR